MLDVMTFTKISNDCQRVTYENGKHVCDLVMDVDGYFYCWMEPSTGCFPARILREISDKMDEINRGWNESISKIPRNPEAHWGCWL